MTFTGAALQRSIQHAFPYLHECVRNQRTGLYTLDFYHPGWQQAVPPADEIARQIPSHLNNAQIVKTYQIQKEYLPEKPIVCSQVTLRLTKYAVGDAAFIPGTQRWSRILEVDARPHLTQPYYRVQLMEGMDHKWYGEDQLVIRERAELDEFDKHIDQLPAKKAKKPDIIPRERALMIVEQAA